MGEDRDSVNICDGKAQMQLLYVGAGDAILLSEAGQPRLRLTKSGMSDWVIWNIGDDDAHSLKDMGEGEQRHYVCVEPRFCTVPVKVAPLVPVGKIERHAVFCFLHFAACTGVKLEAPLPLAVGS